MPKGVFLLPYEPMIIFVQNSLQTCFIFWSNSLKVILNIFIIYNHTGITLFFEFKMISAMCLLFLKSVKFGFQAPET